MIEKLLLRIAQRGSDSLPGGLNGPSTRSGVGPETQPPFATGFQAEPYPATLGGRTQRAGANQTADGSWANAASRYRLGAQAKADFNPQSPYFSGYGALHAALARLIWDERKSHLHSVVHVHHNATLVAAVDTRTGEVLWRNDHPVPQGPVYLNIRQMPRGNGWIDFASQRGFTQGTWQELMWFYAQTQVEALNLVPPSVDTARINLRRFPHIAPGALLTRHLGLIHILSAGPMTFSVIDRFVASENRVFLCADLTALFMQGAIQLMPNQVNPQTAS